MGRQVVSRVTYAANYANPVYGISTICHQVRWLRWGHPSLFHTATSLLIWKKNILRDRYIIQTYMDGINKHVFRVCTIWDAQSFQFMNYCGFNIQPFCSDVCRDHRCPQTLAEPMVVSLLTHICVTRPQWVKPLLHIGPYTRILIR